MTQADAVIYLNIMLINMSPQVVEAMYGVNKEIEIEKAFTEALFMGIERLSEKADFRNYSEGCMRTVILDRKRLERFLTPRDAQQELD